MGADPDGASARSLSRSLLTACCEAGSHWVFGVPGGGSNLELVGTADELGMCFVLTHTETAAAIMAGVVGELTGAPGICVVTRGPGAASAVNGVAQALLDRQPMVLVTDCVAEADRERVSHQRLDQRALLAPVSLVSLPLGPGGEQQVDDLVAMTTGPRPGPVHVDIDVTATGPARRLAAATRSTVGDLSSVAELLAGARRPVVVVGMGTRTAGPGVATRLAASLAELGAATNVPMLTTYRARGVVDDASPWAAGVATGATIEAPVLDAADLVIGVGLDPVELIPAPWAHAAPVVLVGSWSVHDSTFFGHRLVGEIVGDLPTLVDALTSRLAGTWEPGAGQAFRQQMLSELTAAVMPGDGALTPTDVVDVTRRVTPPGTIATVDAGAHMLPVVPRWACAAPGELLISSGLATMGFALPAAIAASLVHPDRLVVCFTGDGGLGMALAELETLARLGTRVVVVVFDDATLSLIAAKQRPHDQGGAAAVVYSAVDFAAVARACGVRAAAVSEVTALEAALREALAHGGPSLIDARVDPSSYPALLDAVRGPRS
ncbi:MAG: thiamine pyrophosphate-binding protein [Acidimicrobiia bacterium]